LEPLDEVLESKTLGDDADNGGGVVINVTIERLPFSFNSCSTLYKEYKYVENRTFNIFIFILTLRSSAICCLLNNCCSIAAVFIRVLGVEALALRAIISFDGISILY